MVGRIVLGGTRIVVPESFRPQMIALAHEGHLGIVGTKQNLRSRVVAWFRSSSGKTLQNMPDSVKAQVLQVVEEATVIKVRNLRYYMLNCDELKDILEMRVEE